MAASSVATRTHSLGSLLPLALQLLPPRARLTLPPPAHRLRFSFQLLRHCASSSPSCCERAQRLRAPSEANGAGCAPAPGEEGDPPERGGDDEADAGEQTKGVGPTLRAAPAGRRRPASPPKGRAGPPRQSGGAKVHSAVAKTKGRRGKPGLPREGPGGGGGVINSVPSSPASSSSSLSSSSSS